VSLERDLSNPMWQAGFAPHLYAEVFAGGALAPLGFGGGADKACNEGECSRSLALGFIAGGRVGYQFLRGFSGELAGGFLYIGGKMKRTVSAVGERDVTYTSDDYEDETRMAGPMVELSAAYTMLDKTPLTFRLGGGVARMKATFKNGGTFSGDVPHSCDNEPDTCDPDESVSVSQRISIGEEPHFMIVPFAAPEVRIGYRFSKKVAVDFGVSFFVMLPPEVIRTGKPKGDEFSNLNRTEGQRRERLDDVPDAYETPSTTARPGVISLDREEGFGIVMAIVPTIAGHFDF